MCARYFVARMCIWNVCVWKFYHKSGVTNISAVLVCVLLELYYLTWWSGPGGIQALSARPTSFLQCFDTVGLVI